MPQLHVIEGHSEEDRSMDPDDARDYADQLPYHDDPDIPGSINDDNLEILAAILEQIPECIDKTNLDCLSDLLPHMEVIMIYWGWLEPMYETSL